MRPLETRLGEELRDLDRRRRHGGLSLSDAARYVHLVEALAADEALDGDDALALGELTDEQPAAPAHP